MVRKNFSTKRYKIKPRILNAEPKGYSSDAKKILSSFAEVDHVDVDYEGIKKIINNYHALILRLRFQIDKRIIDRGKKLKVIATATTGIGHIDIDYAKSKGIDIISLRGENEFLKKVSATAEHTIALILALVRKIPFSFNAVCSGSWDRDSFRGNELKGKILGVFGYGRLGKMVCRYGKSLRMRVIVYDPFENIPEAKKVTLEELIQNSDVFSIHIPLNKFTNKIFNKKTFSQMKKSSFLINTSRGEIIDEKALLHALENRKIGGAALDVLANERSIDLKSSPLISYAKSHHNLIITPHIGGATFESMEKTEIFIARRLKEYFRDIFLYS